MSSFASTSFFTLGCSLGLAACGGGAAAPDDPPPPPANVYETIYSEAAATSILRGVGLGIPQTGQEANEIPLLTVTGSIRHDVGPLSLDDSKYAFTGTMHDVDPGDPGQGVYFSDGSGGVFILSTLDGASFDYVLRYNGEYRLGAVTHSAEGVIGIVMADADVPSGGAANYAGVAFGAGATVAGGSFELLSGNATAAVDFDAGTVSLLADGFADIGAPVDEVRVDGAVIDGASFGSGTISLLNDGVSAEAMLGPNIQSQFGGSFYGYDDVLDIPDELGGLLLKAGDDGYLALYFAAD